LHALELVNETVSKHVENTSSINSIDAQCKLEANTKTLNSLLCG